MHGYVVDRNSIFKSISELFDRASEGRKEEDINSGTLLCQAAFEHLALVTSVILAAGDSDAMLKDGVDNVVHNTNTAVRETIHVLGDMIDTIVRVVVKDYMSHLEEERKD